jgi:hypothetical protein
MTRVRWLLASLVVVLLAVAPVAVAGGGEPKIAISLRRMGSGRGIMRVTVQPRGSTTTYSLDLFSYGTHCKCEIIHELLYASGEVPAGERSKTIEHVFNVSSGETYSLGVGAHNADGEAMKGRELVVR